MDHAHLEQATLEHLLSRDNDEIQNRFLLHLLEVCPECRKAGGYLLELYEAGELDLSFTPVDVDLALSRRQAPALWARLERHGFTRRKALVGDVSRFHSWGLCELLCDRSLAAAADDSAAAVELAELAVLVAEQVERGGAFHEDWSHDLSAYAWAHLGNARRVISELRSAQEAFRRAWELWEQGSGGGLPYLPTLLSLEASLWCDRRRFEEALELLEAARAHSENLGNRLLAAEVMVKKGNVLDEMGRQDEAVDVLREASEQIDALQEPRLLLCSQQNLLYCLSVAGRHGEACELLPAVRELCERLGNQLDLVRLRWVEGKLAAGIGDQQSAEAIFREVRTEFIAQGIGYDAALVSLDLAALWARQGRTAELKALAAEMLLTFQSRDIHREALVALAFFQHAACRERASSGLVEKVATYLNRARNHPNLRFEGC